MVLSRSVRDVQCGKSVVRVNGSRVRKERGRLNERGVGDWRRIKNPGSGAIDDRWRNGWEGVVRSRRHIWSRGGLNGVYRLLSLSWKRDQLRWNGR